MFGLAAAGAALAFGRRRGLVAATALVAAMAALDAFSLALVVVRYYV